jgi:hypothetical protein
MSKSGFDLYNPFPNKKLRLNPMKDMITRRNFRQEYNLLRLECEEVRIQNKYLKNELLKLISMMSNRNMTNRHKLC